MVLRLLENIFEVKILNLNITSWRNSPIGSYHYPADRGNLLSPEAGFLRNLFPHSRKGEREETMI